MMKRNVDCYNFYFPMRLKVTSVDACYRWERQFTTIRCRVFFRFNIIYIMRNLGGKEAIRAAPETCILSSAKPPHFGVGD